jgi:hypothetical protein
MRVAYGLRGRVDRRDLSPARLLRQRDRVVPHGPSLQHSSGTGEHQSLIVRHPVFRVLFGSARDFAIHSRLVALEKREIVTGDQYCREL